MKSPGDSPIGQELCIHSVYFHKRKQHMAIKEGLEASLGTKGWRKDIRTRRVTNGERNVVLVKKKKSNYFNSGCPGVPCPVPGNVNVVREMG